MKRILILAACTLLAILYAGSVSVYSQERNANRLFKSKVGVTPFPDTRNDFKLIGIRNEFGSRNEYKDFVNLVRQLELKQRELDMATVRIFRATHGFFKNDPKRRYYENANINLGLRGYNETVPEMLKLLDSLDTLLSTVSSGPSTKTQSVADTKAFEIIYLLGMHVLPIGTGFDAARRSMEMTQPEIAIREVKITRVMHFFNDFRYWLKQNDVEGCYSRVHELDKEISNSSNLLDAYYEMYERLGPDGGFYEGCLGRCFELWHKGKYFHNPPPKPPPKIKEWIPNVLFPLPPYQCQIADCKSVKDVEAYFQNSLGPVSLERMKKAFVQASFEVVLYDLNPYGRALKTGKLLLDVGNVLQLKRAAALTNNAQEGAIILAVDASGNYLLYSAPIVGNQATFNLPEGVYNGFVVASDNYAVSFENLAIKHKGSVKGKTEICSDCGSIDFIPYPSNADYVYDCDGHCPSCTGCPQPQWVGKFEGSIDVKQPCDDGAGMFTIDGDFTIDFLLDDIKESDLPGGAVQDPDAYHFMNIPTTKAKVKWNNFTHRTCPKGCTISFDRAPPSFEFWTAWDWKVQDDEFVGIDLRFQQLKENTPVYCGPQKTNDFNTYSAGIMALPMTDPDKYVPRTGDVIQRTWTKDQGPVKMKLKMRLEKKKKIP